MLMLQYAGNLIKEILLSQIYVFTKMLIVLLGDFCDTLSKPIAFYYP